MPAQNEALALLELAALACSRGCVDLLVLGGIGLCVCRGPEGLLARHRSAL